MEAGRNSRSAQALAGISSAASVYLTAGNGENEGKEGKEGNRLWL